MFFSINNIACKLVFTEDSYCRVEYIHSVNSSQFLEKSVQMVS